MNGPGSQPYDVRGVANLEQMLTLRWTGRETQVQSLLKLLQRPSGAPVLVHGAESTGKTAVVRDILRTLQRPHAYVSCLEMTKMSTLLRTMLSELKGLEPMRDTMVRCDGLDDFLLQLPGIVAKCGQHTVMVIDRMERLLGNDTFAALLRSSQWTAADVTLVLISRVGFGAGGWAFGTGSLLMPQQVHFPDYEEQDIIKILHQQMPARGDPARYLQFLKHVIGSCWRACQNVEVLQQVAQELYPAYLAPGPLVRRGSGPQPFQAQLQAVLRRFDAACSDRGSATAVAVDSLQVGFEIPYHSKFLLLAAYIASRNKETLDRRVFEPGATAKRRRGALSSDRHVEQVREAKLVGPHSFPLERLLAIFWTLLDTESHGQDEGRSLNMEDKQSCDVFMQISSLVSLRLLTQVTTDPLDGNKYTCQISDDLAKKISGNVKVNLGHYLLYAA